MKEIINRIDYQINNYLDISQQPVNLDELQLEQTASQRRASPMLLKVPKDNDFAYQRCSQNKRSHQLKQNQSGRSKENIKYQNSPSILKNRDLNQHYQEQQSFDNSNNKKYVSNRCNSRSPKSKDIFNHSSNPLFSVMQANILNMNEEQRDVFMRLYNDAEIVKIEKRIEEIVNINENISEQLEASFQNFQKNLKDKLSTFLQKLDNLQLYLNINSSENTIHYLSEQKKSLQNKIQKAKKMQDQIKQINREIQILKIEKISNPFPYKLYGGLCDHVNIQCNTIQIYECCNQAFPCPDCHKNTCKDHKIFFTSPSRRYCIDCLAIFQVNHPTNTLINCSSCLSDYEQISSD